MIRFYRFNKKNKVDFLVKYQVIGELNTLCIFLLQNNNKTFRKFLLSVLDLIFIEITRGPLPNDA